MRFVETSAFTRRIETLLEPDSYRALQLAIAVRPERGVRIPGAGGLRKIRWGAAGAGKRGGIRVIYHWDARRNEVFLLFAYSKREQDDLSREQLWILRRLVREELR